VALLSLAVARGSLRGCVRILHLLSQAPGRQIPADAVVGSVRLLDEYRAHFALCAPLEHSFIGAWKYRTTGPQLNKRPYSSNSYATMATDGSFLYLLNKEGIAKIGSYERSSTRASALLAVSSFIAIGPVAVLLTSLCSGYNGTLQGHIYLHNGDYRFNEKGWLAFCRGRLYYRSTAFPVFKVVAINPETLTVRFVALVLHLWLLTFCSRRKAVSFTFPTVSPSQPLK
jgi:hypothetical protein